MSNNSSKKRGLAEALRSMPKAELAKVLGQLSEEEAEEILYDWRGIWARPNQLYDPNWKENICLVLAGRGWV
jgi:hypothetical protein